MGRPDATASSITEDKWFKTGDIVIRDSDGYFSVVDRLKELIKYKVRMPRLARLSDTDIALTGLPRCVRYSYDYPRAHASTVAPAELESVLIQHPNITDAGVIGVYSETEVTELPR